MEKRVKLFDQFSPIFMEKVFIHPKHSLKTSRDIISVDQAIENSISRLLDKVEKLVKQSPELSTHFDMKKFKEEFQKSFDKARLKKQFVQTHESAVQLSFSELEQEVDVEAEQIKNLSRDFSLNFTPHKPIEFKKSYEDLSQYKLVSTYYPEHKQFLSNNLLSTENYFTINEKSIFNFFTTSDLYKVTMKPARYSLVVHNKRTKSFKLILLDLYDAQYLQSQMKEDAAQKNIRSDHEDFYLIGNDRMNLVAENGKEPWSEEVKGNPLLRELMIEARPYTGMLNFDYEDQAVLEEKGEEGLTNFLASIDERFTKPWPYYEKTLDNLSRLLL